MSERWQLKHITPEQCREAARRAFTGTSGSTLHHLMEITGAPEKVCLRKLESLLDGVRMECSVSARWAWWVADEGSLSREKPTVADIRLATLPMFPSPADIERAFAHGGGGVIAPVGASGVVALIGGETVWPVTREKRQ